MSAEKLFRVRVTVEVDVIVSTPSGPENARELARMAWEDQVRDPFNQAHAGQPEELSKTSALTEHELEQRPWGHGDGDDHRTTVGEVLGLGDRETRERARRDAREARWLFEQAGRPVPEWVLDAERAGS